jgi:hypothetical protein
MPGASQPSAVNDPDSRLSKALSLMDLMSSGTILFDTSRILGSPLLLGSPTSTTTSSSRDIAKDKTPSASGEKGMRDSSKVPTDPASLTFLMTKLKRSLDELKSETCDRSVKSFLMEAFDSLRVLTEKVNSLSARVESVEGHTQEQVTISGPTPPSSEDYGNLDLPPTNFVRFVLPTSQRIKI